MPFAELDVLETVYPRITQAMTSSERADLIVEALLHFGADLLRQPTLEEMKRLFMKVMRFRSAESTNHESLLAI